MKTENKKNGFTLVELLVGVSILVLLIMIAVGTLNPKVLVDKANDSNKKSDLNKLRTAFEEYQNDKGSYPDYEKIAEWNVVSNCGKVISEIKSYVKQWPCGVNNELYTVIMGRDWFKIITNLKNKKDKDIPEGWYGPDTYSKYSATFARDLVNYGVSSANVLWYQDDIPIYCDNSRCYSTTGNSHCNAFPATGCVTGGGTQCYLGNSITGQCGDPLCPVAKCH